MIEIRWRSFSSLFAGCKDFRGEYTPFDWDTDEEKFAITAVEWRTDPVNRLVKTTVLSVTISNFSFHSEFVSCGKTTFLTNNIDRRYFSSLTELDFRLVDRTDPPIEGEYCQRITFDKDKLPRQITLHIMAWYRRRTQIQFVGHGNERTFFREFHFLAPSHYALSWFIVQSLRKSLENRGEFVNDKFSAIFRSFLVQIRPKFSENRDFRWIFCDL